jgi:streptomycin 3"-adenylyltransferase
MAQVGEVVRLVDQVLGPDHIGSYPHGSSVLGHLRPASDIDILTVSARSLHAAQRRALVVGLLPLSGSTAGMRPVELTVVVQQDVRPWRYPPRCDFLYGEWLRGRYLAGETPEPEPMPGLALEISVALRGHEPLHGPPVTHVLDPVPPADVVRASVEGIPSLLADLSEDTRNVVLTLARVWVTLATGEILSKDAAASWALQRLPAEHRPVLAHARQLYLETSYVDERWSEELRGRVGPHVTAVLAEIRALSAGQG